MPVIESIKRALHIGTDAPAATPTSTTTAAPTATTTTTTATPVAVATPTTTTTAVISEPASTATPVETPVFSAKEVTVLFVLGGPGVGKGTQCANLVADYHFVHLSAGDLLRAEQDRPGSEYGEMIKSYIREGQIVPMEVTVKLLQNAITEKLSTPNAFPVGMTPRFLVDGFPRKMDQAHKFDDSVCPSAAVIFFSCSEEVMLVRLKERGKTSGRADDNEESIMKRFRTFVETSMPVVDYYRGLDKVYEIPAFGTKEEVYVKVREAVDGILAKAQ